MSRFKINQVNQYKFYQSPQALFTVDKYRKLSSDAKYAYSILLDRMHLSAKNNWINENNEIYLIFSREKMATLLGISHPTCSKAFKQLNQVGLIEEVRRGLNLPNLIYINEIELETNKIELESIENTGTLKFLMSGDKEFLHQDIKNFNANNTNINNTNINNKEKEEEEAKTEASNPILPVDNSVNVDISMVNSDIDKENLELKNINYDSIEFYRKNIDKNIGEYETSKINELCEMHTDDLVKKAIEIAILNNAKKLKYIINTLEDWNKKNIKTVHAADLNIKEWDKTNKEKKEKRKINNYNANNNNNKMYIDEYIPERFSQKKLNELKEKLINRGS